MSIANTLGKQDVPRPAVPNSIFSRIGAVAFNTFREAVRDRVLYNLILFAFLMIGSSLLLGQITIAVQKQLLINLGLTAISIFGVLIAIFIGIGLVSKEIDRRTLYTVLTRPVARWEFIVGKYFGLVGTLVVNAGLMTIGFFVALLYLMHGLQASDLSILAAVYFILLQFTIMTAIALLLGTLASLAVARHRFFGRETISFLVILPIALPGIVTGVALSNTFTQVLNVPLSLFTVIVGHATFCIVVVYNNTIARLRRLSTSFEEASADLGAHTWQTFRHITFPGMKSALIAGGLLAFALSFDEIIVTNFTIGPGEETLPIWIFRNLFRPKELPVVPAVAVILIILSIIPVYLAHRLSSDDAGLTPGRGGGATATPGAIAETEAASAH